MSRRTRQWIGFLVMVIGLVFLSGPFILGAREGRRQEQAVDSFYRQSGRTPSKAETEIPEGKSEEPARDSFYQAAAQYNDALAASGETGISSRADVETFALSALDYGYTENLIGTIRIPRLEVELALYLGASTENMAKGAAVFGMTSLPLGRENENAAIAGHRGWRGTPVFRDIQLIQEGDPIYITTPWDTLTYRVCDMRIVSPDDTSWCAIQPGRALITLMTCHPYGKSNQRYIVFAELCREEMPSEEEILQNNRDTFDPAAREITVVHEDGTQEKTTVVPARVEPDSREYGILWSDWVLWAESRMKGVAWIAGVLVAGTGIWLTVCTVGDHRRKNEKHRPE